MQTKSLKLQSKETLEHKWRFTWRVRALVFFVTKKLVKLTKYAREELNSRYQMILISSLASANVIPTTFASIKSVAGSRSITAIGAMYRRRFIEFNFSLDEENSKHFSFPLYDLTQMPNKKNNKSIIH